MEAKTVRKAVGHCGREGRVARAMLRNRELDSRAADHLASCPCCRERVAQAYLRNGGTTYKSDSLTDILPSMRRTRWSY